jgi:hypothetical protein
LLGLSQTGERVERRAALARVHSCHPVPREIRPGETEEDYRRDLRTNNPPKWHLHSELVAPSKDAADGGGRVRRRAAHPSACSATPPAAHHWACRRDRRV